MASAAPSLMSAVEQARDHLGERRIDRAALQGSRNARPRIAAWVRGFGGSTGSMDASSAEIGSGCRIKGRRVREANDACCPWSPKLKHSKSTGAHTKPFWPCSSASPPAAGPCTRSTKASPGLRSRSVVAGSTWPTFGKGRFLSTGCDRPTAGATRPLAVSHAAAGYDAAVEEEVVGILRHCSTCGKKTTHVGGVCRDHASRVTQRPDSPDPSWARRHGLKTGAVLAAVVVLALGDCHVLYGGGGGLKLCRKDGYTFADTFIDREDLIRGEKFHIKVFNALDKCHE